MDNNKEYELLIKVLIQADSCVTVAAVAESLIPKKSNYPGNTSSVHIGGSTYGNYSSLGGSVVSVREVEIIDER